MLSYAEEKINVINVLRAVLLLFVVYAVIRYYWIRNQFLKLVRNLPTYKLRFYHVLGHYHFMLPYRIFRGQVSPDVYDFFMFLSMHVAFAKEPMLFAWQFCYPAISVYRADSVELILNHSKELKKAWFYSFLFPWLGTGLLTSNDDKWKRRRKMLTPAFHFNILKDFLPVFNKQSKILVEVFKQNEQKEYLDLVPFITKCSFDIICESILGEEVHSQTKESSPYLKSVGELTRLTFIRNQFPWLWPDFLFKMSPEGRRFAKNNKVVQEFTEKIIRQKKAEKLKFRNYNENKSAINRPDENTFFCNKRALLDLLLEEHINDPNSISVEEIKEEVNTFTFEGHDTTAMAMSWSLYLIGLHPEVQEKVHAELDDIFGDDERDVTVDDLKSMKYLECVLKETLRLYPSVPFFARELQEDLKFDDKTLPKGSTCIVFAYMLHRNPVHFPNPELFDPERFRPENSAGRHPFAYVPFSAGARNCIGQRFALMEEKTVLSTILRKYKVTSLDPRDKVHVVDFMVLRPEKKLRIKITPRNSEVEEFILRFCLIVAIGNIVVKVFYKRRQFVSLVNKIPALKLRTYHFLGHVHAALYVRLYKRIFPPHVYDFLGLTGYMYLFKNESLANLWQFYRPFVVVYKADSVETILNHSTELEKAWFYKLLHPWLRTGLLTSNNLKWRNRRKLLTPAFHFNILRDFLLVFNKQSRILVDILHKHTKDDCIDIVPFIARCSFDIICESIHGAEIHSQMDPSNPYVNAVNALTSTFFERMQNPPLWPEFIFKLSPLGRRFYRNLKIAHDFTDKLIAEKKKIKLEQKDASQRTDSKDTDCYKRSKRALLDLLLEEHINQNSISETEIREEVDTFTFEGHDTTAISMSWTLYLIGLHPSIQSKVREELDCIFQDSDRDATADDLKDMKYLESVIKESLRLYPSVPVFGRNLNEDIQIQGRIVPRGSTCVVFPYILHRDPEVFPNPEKFDPERFFPENCIGRHPFAYVPFSAGPRNCIGQRFAMMEEKTVISSILRKYKIRSLDPRDKVQIVDEVVLRPLEGIRIEINPRKKM
ncbi:uncharacterized protein LOC129216283 [Uloborus diversus]|uniref:uncharacterized protein LOC129216283 n=1 Tax=Uloborus diversus TaxID=327109 RepID=UPI0024096BDC|nr:uncharacterized protein LOC129216283 [Uloborus diversus]